MQTTQTHWLAKCGVWAPLPPIASSPAGEAAAVGNVMLHTVERPCKSTMGQELLPWSRGLGQAHNTSIDKLCLPVHCPAKLILILDLGERNGKQLNTLLLLVAHIYLNTTLLISLVICFCSVFCIIQVAATVNLRIFCLREVRSCAKWPTGYLLVAFGEYQVHARQGQEQRLFCFVDLKEHYFRKGSWLTNTFSVT